MKNNIKLVLFWLLSITILTSCNTDKPGDFTVSGKITNPSADTVFLQELAYNNDAAKNIDSAKIATDGSYKLAGSSAQQNLYVLSFKNDPAVILINDSKDIKIDVNLNGFHFPSVNGSDATKQLYVFIQNYWQKDSLLSLTYYQLDSMGSSSIKDSTAMRNIQQQYTKQLNDLDDVIRNFIKKTNNPAAICFALDKAKGVLSPDELGALFQDAATRFPQHTGIALFKSSIAPPATDNFYALLNAQAPNLTMPDMNGKAVSINSFKGKYLLVDFWASWCGPCRQENPNVVKAYHKFKDKNFEILGVSLDNDKSAWMQAVKNDNLIWPQMSDLKQMESAAVTAYQFEGIPFNVLIDPQGKIIASGLRGDALEAKLAQVLQ